MVNRSPGGSARSAETAGAIGEEEARQFEYFARSSYWTPSRLVSWVKICTGIRKLFAFETHVPVIDCLGESHNPSDGAIPAMRMTIRIRSPVIGSSRMS